MDELIGLIINAILTMIATIVVSAVGTVTAVIVLRLMKVI